MLTLENNPIFLESLSDTKEISKWNTMYELDRKINIKFINQGLQCLGKTSWNSLWARRRTRNRSWRARVMHSTSTTHAVRVVLPSLAHEVAEVKSQSRRQAIPGCLLAARRTRKGIDLRQWIYLRLHTSRWKGSLGSCSVEAKTSPTSGSFRGCLPPSFNTRGGSSHGVADYSTVMRSAHVHYLDSWANRTGLTSQY